CASVTGDCSGIFCFTSYGLDSW
nr:immunoglobulin heavy chain junction region [Macaca mulatta]MOV53536.1 immunoglobulin heavy chain junction region [Macaca mulatta]MOV53541.1 immunoglobulin heavy chain junction region [Macaca mulatta]MOV53624.1 immunoglobulin heavy chain junction region [Macaca mulatta]MOV53746.1 immunoglobulin heavy chain junction region [Macaca mulatta]